MSERKKIEIDVNMGDNPSVLVEEEMRDVESKGEYLEVDVYAGRCGGFAQVEELAKALTRFHKPNVAFQLWLQGNELESVPGAVWLVPNLEEVGLGGNKLRTWPAELAQLSHLKVLNLNNNDLTELPPVVCELKSLKVLGLHGNKLRSLPAELAKLSHLKLLGLGNNDLTELPQVVCELTNLEELYLYDNKLSFLPATIVQLIRLKELGLERNQFESIPLCVGRLPQLEKLFVAGRRTISFGV